MNVFVTGITGFCGSHIAGRLIRGGHSLCALVRDGRAGDSEGCGYRIIRGDLGSLQELPKNIDVIVHTAAKSPVRGSVAGDFVENNIVGTQRLCSLAAAAGIRKFIFFSSLSIYGEISLPVVAEDTPVVSPGAYGASKLMCEFILRDHARAFSSVALRLPAVLGRGASRHWLATLAMRAKCGEELEIFNPEAAFNNAVHIEDLATLVESLLLQEWRGSDAVTLGADGTLSIAEIADRIVAGSRTKARIVIVPPRQPSFVISSERAKLLYGYRPMSFPVMLARYLTEL